MLYSILIKTSNRFDFTHSISITRISSKYLYVCENASQVRQLAEFLQKLSERSKSPSHMALNKAVMTNDEITSVTNFEKQNILIKYDCASSESIILLFAILYYRL